MKQTTQWTRHIFATAIVVAFAITSHAQPHWTKSPLERDNDEGATPCDWLEFHAKPDNGNLLLAYRCTRPINFDVGAAYCVYLDTDANRKTGFRGSDDAFPIGADYLLQGATLFIYTGEGTDWSWSFVGTVDHTVSGRWASFTLTPELVPIEANTIHTFLIGDNTAPGVNGNKDDIMPNKALRAGGGGAYIRVSLK